MDNEQVHVMRHSLAHIMAAAIKRLWPDAKFGVGPVIENGFYYDIDLGEHKISETDFPKIEKEMHKIIQTGDSFESFKMPIDQAIKWARQNNQPYKEELLNDLSRTGTTIAKEIDIKEIGLGTKKDPIIKEVTFYKNGDFIDLCRGPHVSSMKDIGAFKVSRVAGAYWRGDEKRSQMQRLYGVAFATQEELDNYLHMIEEARKRDHRKLGQELDLFVFSRLIGSGLPLFTPRGTILRDELITFAESLRKAAGFQRVNIPHIAKTDLYKISGHWDKFGDELFLVKSQETSDQFALKPMNCPHHNQIYASSPRSYRELPIRYFETTTVYRDEKTGELGGLSRVRSISQDDSHIYARRDQLSDEVALLIADIQTIYSTLGMNLRARLSFRDMSEKYLGEPTLWELAQKIIVELAEASKLDFFTAEGEAAFYGPKIDFMATDAIGREHQVATVQVDFVMPERFQLEYVNQNGEKECPVMIHCALLGSIERFLSVYIEHTAGRFPTWLSPEQLRIVQVKDDEKVSKLVQELREIAATKSIRFTVDDSNGSVGKKIRAAEVMKVPYTLVIGEKEVTERKLMPRIRNDLTVKNQPKSDSTYDIDQFFTSLHNEICSRASQSAL
jgi:threonyl-tRNA synthetase